jgi:hypothetical protein
MRGVNIRQFDTACKFGRNRPYFYLSHDFVGVLIGWVRLKRLAARDALFEYLRII